MKKQRALLFANGEVCPLSGILNDLQQDDYLVAVDGGLRSFTNSGRNPDLLIGDLDSADSFEIERLKTAGVEIIRFPIEKDETDLELAILETRRRGFLEIILMGALGGRLDHTLANLNLLLLPEIADIEIKIRDEHQEVFLIRERVLIQGRKGDLISLIPIKGNAIGVETEGLQYPLKKEELQLERSRGISNVMLKNQVEINLESGLLLCVHTFLEE